MYVFGNMLYGFARVLGLALNLYSWVILIAVVLTWVNADPYNGIVQFFRRVTEPAFAWIRRHLPSVFGGLDLSPIYLYLIIIFLQYAVVQSLMEAAFRMK